jgi:hypothetical protein
MMNNDLIKRPRDYECRYSERVQRAGEVMPGMCKSHLSEIINGRTRHPSVWTVQRIADALGCRVDDLLNVRVPV